MTDVRHACRAVTSFGANAPNFLSPDGGFERFASLLRRLPAPCLSVDAKTPIVLAVSGGADSLALLLVAGDNRPAFARLGFVFHVVTVDHGLRDGSAAEACQVGRIAGALGLPHETRRWTGVKPVSNVQATARAARYRHLLDVARRIGASAIVTAHHQDDQIETHLLAAQRAAGDRGLSGMRDMRELAPGIRLLRPFLSLPGASLKEAVSARDLPAVADPGNDDRRYDRVRLRQALASGGADRAAVLSAVARHAERRDADDGRLATCLDGLSQSRALICDDFGVVWLADAAFREIDAALRVALLSRVVPAVGGAAYAPGRPALERLAAGLWARGGDDGFAATLGGTLIRGGRTLVFSREFGRTGPPRQNVADLGAGAEFDRRFEVTVDLRLPEPLRAVRGMTLAPFGSLGRGNAVERTLPVLVAEDGRPVAVPSSLRHKAPEAPHQLFVRERISWRLRVDLPSVHETGNVSSGMAEAD